MITDYNLIAYEFIKDQFSPNPIYKSGAKDEDKPVYSNNTKELALMVLEDDIINKNGYGLKKGFYNVVASNDLDFLLIYQMGNLKAKIPVIKMKIDREKYSNKPQKIEKMSGRKYKKYLKKQEKEKRKYFNGENPNELEYMSVKIEYIKENNAWIIEYINKDITLYGMIKF